MASVCYPKHTPEGQLLIDRVTEMEAIRDWIEHGYIVRTPEEVEDKIRKELMLPLIQTPGTEGFKVNPVSPVVKDLEKKLVNGFLKDFDITVKEYDDLKEELGIDAYSGIQLITKSIVHQPGETILPEVAYLAYKFLNKKNSKIRSNLRYLITKWDKYDDLFKFYKGQLRYKGELETTATRYRVIRDRIIVDFLQAKMIEYQQNPNAAMEKVSDVKWLFEDLSEWKKFVTWVKEQLAKLKPNYTSEQVAQLNWFGQSVAQDIIEKTYDYYTYNKAEDLVLKGYEETIEKDPFAAGILNHAIENGLIATGSIVVRRMGTLFRPRAEDVHDLDFVVPHDLVTSGANKSVYDKLMKDLKPNLEEAKHNPKVTQVQQLAAYDNHIEASEKAKKHLESFDFYKQMKKKYPSLTPFNVFFGADHTQLESLTACCVIDGEFYTKKGTHTKTVSSYARDPETMKVIPVKKEITKEHKKGDYIEGTGYVVDFFVRLAPGQSEHKNYFLSYKEIFLAKLMMDREKDWTDWVYFTPWVKSEDKFDFTAKNLRDFRYLTYESTAPKPGSVQERLAQDLTQEAAGNKPVIAYSKERPNPYEALTILREMKLIDETGFTKSPEELKKAAADMQYKYSIHVSFPGDVYFDGHRADAAYIESLATPKDTAYYRTQEDVNQSPAALNSAITQLPFELKTADLDNANANMVLKTLAENLSYRTGINYVFITPDRARAITEKASNPWRGEKAFFLGETVYFVGPNLNTNMVFHEFAHPVVRSMAIDNPVLFENMYTSLAGTGEGEKIIDDVTADYKELKPGSTRFKEEVLVHAIAARAEQINNNTPATPEFVSLIDRILYHIKQFLRNMFGRAINISKLSPITTIDEISSMLTTEKFDLDSKRLSDTEVADYVRELKGYIKDRDIDAQLQPERPLAKHLGEYIDALYVVSNVKPLIKAVEEENFEYIMDVMKDKMGEDITKEIRTDISKFRKEVLLKAGEEITDMKNLDNATRQLALALERLLEISKEFEKEMQSMEKRAKVLLAIDELAPHEAAELKAYLLRSHYIMSITKHWDKYINDNVLGLRQSLKDHPEDSAWKKLINSLSNTFINIRAANNPVVIAAHKAVGYATMEPMAKLIDQKLLPPIAAARAAGQNALADKLQKEYDEHALNPKRIEKMLRGEWQDASYLNNWLESYFYSADDIVGGFTVWLTKHLSEVDANTTQRFGDFLDEVLPIMEKLGYNPNQLHQLLEWVSVVDETGYIDEEGKFTTQQVYRLKSRHIRWQVDRARMEHAITEADKLGKETGDFTEFTRLSKELDDWEEKYLYRDYKDEVYAMEKIWDKTYTNEFGELVPIGEIAKRKRSEIFERMTLLDQNLQTEDERLDKISAKDALWKEYRQLFSLKDEKDEYKTGEELMIAEIIQEYKEESKKYHEFRLNPNKFQEFHEAYMQSLINQGISPEDPATAPLFDHKMNLWREANMTISYTPEYYTEVEKIFKVIKDILAKAKGKSAQASKLADLYKDMLDTLSKYRDEDGEPVGPEMSEATREKIKKLQLEINELQSNMNSSLTTAQQKRMRELEGIYDRKGFLTDKEEEEWDLLSVARSMKDLSGLTSTERAMLAAKWKQLRTIREKTPTSYYLEVINGLTKGTEIPEIVKFQKANKGKDGRVDPFMANWLLRQPHLIKALIHEEKKKGGKPVFKKWFEDNHIMIERWDSEQGGFVKQWERLPQWSVARPKLTKYFEHTQVLDHNGQVISIMGKPSIRFHIWDVKGLTPQEQKELRLLTNREVRYALLPYEEARKAELLEKERVGYKTPRVLGQTVDIKGRWLPRGPEEGAPEDTPYINHKYEQFATGTEKEKLQYELIEAVKRHYLNAQVGADTYAQLYLDLPRFQRQGLEKLVGSDDPRIAKTDNPFKRWWRDTKAMFMPAPDDPDRGFNMAQPVDTVKLVAADMFDTQQERMPVDGIYHKDIRDVSPDVLYGIARYFGGLERQKKLKEIHPFAQSLKDTLANPTNRLDPMMRVNKQNYTLRNLLRFVGKKGDYVRHDAIKALMDREFYGQQQAGAITHKGINAVVNMMFKGASFSYLAVQLPSAVTNMLAQVTQNVIEGVGGEHYSMKDLALGSVDASEAVSLLAMEIYQKGHHSLEVQKIELFDALPGRSFDAGGKFGTQSSRTFLKDAFSLSWLYSPRKFMENFATLQAYYAMMRNIKIEQTINGNTNLISYNDAFHLVDGRITLKEGIDKKYDVGGEEFTILKNKMKMIQYAMNGVYDKLGEGDSQRYLVFKMFSFLRRYFVTMLTNRFAKMRHNPGALDIKTGYYVEAYKALNKMIISKGWSYNQMSVSEKAAFKKIFAELGIVMLTQFAMSAFFGWDPDDDEKYEKLRARSGPLPILGVAESDYPFQWDGWLANHTLLQLMKVQSQTQMWVPLPNWGLEDYTSMASMESAAIGPTIDLYQKILTDVMNYAWSNEAAFYQHTVGPYQWQQEEQFKLFNHVGTILGLRGATVEPVYGITKEALIRTRR